MFSIIWRGAGIFVIIALAISAWLTGYAFEETTLGNGDYIKWVLLWAGIPVTLLGLALFPLQKDEAGKWKYVGGHDLFWIPMIVWGIGLLGFSVKLFAGGSAPDANPYAQISQASLTTHSQEEMDPVAKLMAKYPDNHMGIAANERVIKLFNPTDEEIEIRLIDDAGKAEEVSGPVAPKSTSYLAVEASDYTFTFKDEVWKLHVTPSTTLNNQDQDEIWLVLDTETDLLVVDASATCDKNIRTREELEAIDFSDAIYQRYDGSKPIEMYVRAGNTYMRMREPYYSWIRSKTEGEQIFSVIPIAKSEKTTEDFVSKFLASICFKTEGVTVF